MMHRKFLSVGLTAIVWLFLATCSDSPPTKTDTESPAAPTLLGPADHGTEVGLGETLVWRCSDPNNDALTYALYFGQTNPPPLLIEKLLDTTYVVKDLEPGKTYFWKVVASDDDGHSAGSRVMTFATTRSFQYPLAIGIRWGYDRTFVVDSVSGGATPSIQIDEATVGVGGDTVLFDSIPAVMIHTVTGSGRDATFATLYSSNTAEGMFTYAYTNGSVVAPGKTTSTRSYVVNGRQFSSLQELSASFPIFGQGAARAVGELTVEEPPVRVLDYPLSDGVHWMYREAGHPWRIDRRVTGWESIETPAGKFNAFRIESLYDFDDDGVWDDNIVFVDHVAPEGLASRDILILGVEVYDENNEFLGVVNHHETYQLREYGSD